METNNSVNIYFTSWSEEFEMIYPNSSPPKGHYAGPIGATLVDFSCCDFDEGFNLLDEIEKNSLQNKSLDDQLGYLSLCSMFFYFFYIFGYSKKDDRDLLINLRDDVQLFIRHCLDVDMHQDLTADERLSKYINSSSFSDTLLSLSNAHISMERRDDPNRFTPYWATILKSSDLHEIFSFLMIKLLNEEIQCRVCKNCGKYFIASEHLTTLYCNRIAPNSTKTCKEIGAVKQYLSSQSDNKVLMLYNRFYRTRHARIKSGKMTKEEVQNWAKEARIMRQNCYAGEISFDAFKQWLQEH